MQQETQQPSSDHLKNLPQEQLIQLLTQLLQQQNNNQLNRITIEELCDKHLKIAEAREYTKNSYIQ